MNYFTNLINLKFYPYSRYNHVIDGIFWHNINYND